MSSAEEPSSRERRPLILYNKGGKMMWRSTPPNIFHSFWLVAVFLLLLAPANAKITSGKIHLSGVKTEATLVKFAISPSSSAKIDLNITSYGECLCVDIL